MGTSVWNIPLASLLTFQATHSLLFLAARCVCFFLNFLSSLPQGEVGESGLPGPHGLPGATGPKVTLKLRVSGAIS